MRKILAIDDKKDNLVTLSALLKNLMPGFVVITAQSGREGIGKAKAELPDVILLDVKMPDMDGFETCARLKADENTKRIPVIMITAIKTDPRSRIKGLELGANTFLAKPIDEVELMSQVKVALRIKEAEDALRKERDSLERAVEERTASLRESETLYRSLFENMLNGFSYCRMHFDDRGKPSDFTYLIVNKAFATLTGLTDVVGKTVSDVIPGIRKVDPELLEIYGRVAESGRPERFEMFVKSLQMWFWISVYCPKRGYFVAVFDVITDRKQAEEALRRSTERLRKTLGATVQAIATVVETRDPYTAGHQKKVADLARAIAWELGLSEDQVDGLRMAAVIHDIGKISVPAEIHDIGKISVPAEILSKPSKLTEVEFGLIKIHPQSGYDILKDVEFPWPIARMVLEHHERVNGSGYPNGLTGDKLLIESRILAVTDVVESMASHRPYRPAIGIEAALKEIGKNRGTLYDPDVVDACLRLIREKGFRWAQEKIDSPTEPSVQGIQIG